MADAAEERKGLTDDQIVRLVNSDFDTALGAPGGEISLDRQKAYERFLQEDRGDEEEERSSVHTSDVADVVDGYMPSMMRIFTTAENVVSFDPVSVEDEAAAQQESDYVSHIFFKRNPAFEIVFFWVFDAILRKTGITKAYWDTDERVEYETWTGLTELEYLAKLQDDELSLVEKSKRKTEVLDPNTNQFVAQEVIDVKFKRVTNRGRCVVENVPPDEYRVSKDCRSLDPSSASMVGHEREVKRSDLLQMGFDPKIVNKLNPDELEGSSERTANKNKSDDRREPNARNPDRSQDTFVLREAYKKIDVDGDGIAELMKVHIVNDTLLDKEPVDRQPFHVLCPQPLPHKHIGRSIADRVMDVQTISTTLLRQILDNLYQTNNPGHGVWEQGLGETTLDDLLTREIGNVTVFRRPLAESYAPMAVPFTAGDSFPMVEYFEKIKKDRVGINSDSEGLTPEALKNIQTTVMAQATDLSRMKIELVARIFAETGFKSLFRHIHELVQKNQNKADVFRLRGQYVQVDPMNWKHRADMTVHVGLGIGTREQNNMHLQMIWEMQRAMVEGGGMNLTVTPKNIYNTGAEFVKNANYKEPAVFFTDPGDQPAPPESSEAEELQRQQQALMERQQKLDAMKNQLDQTKLQLDAQKEAVKNDREMLELQRKFQKDANDYEVALQKLRNEITDMELKYNQNLPGNDTPPGNGL